MKTGLTFKDLQNLECNTVLYQRGRVLKPRSRMASFTANSDQFCRSETKTLVGSECLAAGPTPSLGVSSSPTDLLSGCARHQPSPAPSSTPGFTLAQGTMLVTSRQSVATTQQPPLNLESHLPAWHPSPHPLAYTGLGRFPGTGSTLCTGGPSFFRAHSPFLIPWKQSHLHGIKAVARKSRDLWVLPGAQTQGPGSLEDAGFTSR